MQQDCNYAFKNRKTGIVIIAQSWAEFHHYQKQTNGWASEWIALDSIQRNGTCSNFYTEHQPTWHACERFNKFWSGAMGYEKVGKIHNTAYHWDPYRLFKTHVLNCAAMEGDKETYTKVYTELYTTKLRLALPPSTTEQLTEADYWDGDASWSE